MFHVRGPVIKKFYYLSIDTADRQIFQLGYGIVAVLLNNTLGFLQVPAAGGHHFLIIRIM